MKILDESTIDEFMTRLEELTQIWPEGPGPTDDPEAELGMTGWLRSIGVGPSSLPPIPNSHPKATIGLIADRWTYGRYSRLPAADPGVFKEVQSLLELGFIAGYVWAHARDES